MFRELVLLTDNALRSATAFSLYAGATLMIRRSAFDALRSGDANVDLFLVSVLAERNRTLTAHLVELLFTPVEQRVYRRFGV